MARTTEVEPPANPADDITASSMTTAVSLRCDRDHRSSRRRTRFATFNEWGTSIITGLPAFTGTRWSHCNNGIIFSEAALKATHFIELAEQRRTLLFAEHHRIHGW